jgi:hypothetical protein
MRKIELNGAGGDMQNVFASDRSQIDLEFVARSLATKPRFNGQTPLSVAQHCVTISNVLDFEEDKTNALWGLFHDYAEAYIGDCPTPVKNHRAMRGFVRLEEQILKCMAKAFNLPYPMPLKVRQIDERIVIDEALTYFPNRDFWYDFALKRGLKPLGIKIETWDGKYAMRQYLETAERLLSQHDKKLTVA